MERTLLECLAILAFYNPSPSQRPCGQHNRSEKEREGDRQVGWGKQRGEREEAPRRLDMIRNQLRKNSSVTVSQALSPIHFSLFFYSPPRSFFLSLLLPWLNPRTNSPTTPAGERIRPRHTAGTTHFTWQERSEHTHTCRDTTTTRDAQRTLS